MNSLDALATAGEGKAPASCGGQSRQAEARIWRRPPDRLLAGYEPRRSRHPDFSASRLASEGLALTPIIR
jgi:hypothetical protein